MRVLKGNVLVRHPKDGSRHQFPRGMPEDQLPDWAVPLVVDPWVDEEALEPEPPERDAYGMGMYQNPFRPVTKPEEGEPAPRRRGRAKGE